MQLTHRSTPCVGICSTTYGDLICRGCKRFAHEVVGWNSFAPTQRDAVWQRLRQLLDGAVNDHLRVMDSAVLRSSAEQFRVPNLDQLGDLELAYEVLRRSRVQVSELAAAGIEMLPCKRPLASSRELLRLIDEEFFRRSLAHYERNYRIAAQ